MEGAFEGIYELFENISNALNRHNRRTARHPFLSLCRMFTLSMTYPLLGSA